MSARASELAKKLGPKLSSAGNGAKGALGGLLGAIRKRRDERKQERELTHQPRRKTAPPPSGALRSDGKRLFREAQQEEAVHAQSVAVASTAGGAGKLRVAAGAVVGMLTVVALYLGAQQFMRNPTAGTPATAANEAPPTPAKVAANAPDQAIPQGGTCLLYTSDAADE